MDFMRAWIGDRTEKPEFARPGNVLLVSITPPEAGEAFSEVFISGTQPAAGEPPPPPAPAATEDPEGPPPPAPPPPAPPAAIPPARE
jgi:hypothetical protein